MQRRRAARRARRFAGVGLILAVAVITLVLTAFGSAGGATTTEEVAVPAARLLPAGPPTREVVAARGDLRLQLPIAQTRITAIGFHAGAGLALQPVGKRGNQGLLGRLGDKIFGTTRGGLVWYQLDGGTSGPATAVLDVGAAPGTDVYAPVDGAIVGISDLVVDGKRMGVRIDIRPTGASSLVVSVTRLRADPALVVGSTVTAAGTKLGSLLDFSAVERQTLARYTQDAGNHVAVEVRPAATLSL